VNLAWEDTSNELGFEIERKEGSGGSYHQIAKVGENTTTYIDTAPKTGVTYYYRVRAYNSAGHSSYSDEVCVEITAD
jgi:titin